MRTVKVSLSEAGLSELARQITEYKNAVRSKVTESRKAVADYLEMAAGNNAASCTVNDYEGRFAGIIEYPSLSTAQVAIDANTDAVELKGKQVAFVEFGAGVHHNPNGSAHPKANEVHAVIGGYGEHQGLFDHWVFHVSKEKYFITRGTPAQMPLWRAGQETENKKESIVKEVFGK